MKGIVLWAVIGFAIGVALSMLLNPIFWGGEDYPDSFAWGVVGALVGFLWLWREARRQPTP
jgi:membrane protein DedA with SNARE-associated domain